MNTGTKLTLLAAGLALLLAGEISWRQAGLLRQRTAALAEAERQNWELRHQLAQAKIGAHPASAPSSPPRAANATPGAVFDYATNYLRAKLTPEEIRSRRALTRASAISGNFELLRFLRLTPAQLDQFGDIVADATDRALKVRLAITEQQRQQLGGNSVLASQWTEQERTETESTIANFLGPDGYARYQYYNQTLAERPLVQQLQQRLTLTDAALTDDQSEQLVKLLADNYTPAPPEVPAPSAAQFPFGSSGVNGARRVPLLTDTVMAQAQGVLSPAQFAGLQAMQRSQQAVIESHQGLPDPGPPLPPR